MSSAAARRPGRPADVAVDPSVALAELSAARSSAIDEREREAFARLLRGDPGSLYRDGQARSADGRRLHLTASAFVLDRDGEALALLWHPKGSFWVQPGGHIDPPETSLEAASRREVAEELGLTDLERIGPGPALLHRHPLAGAFGACGEHWDVEYLFRASQPAAALARVPSPEEHDVVWVPWPRESSGAHRPDVPLPAGTVPDAPGKIAALASYQDRWLP